MSGGLRSSSCMKVSLRSCGRGPRRSERHRPEGLKPELQTQFDTILGPSQQSNCGSACARSMKPREVSVRLKKVYAET